MKNLYSFLFLLITFAGYGQGTFERVYEDFQNGTGYSVIEDTNGGFYFCGTNNYPSLWKADSIGLVEWSVSEDIFGYYSVIRQISDDRVVVGGKMDSWAHIAVYDEEGNEEWSNSYLTDRPCYVGDIEIAENGNLVVAISFNYSWNAEASEPDALVRTFTPTGELVSEYIHNNPDKLEFFEDLVLLSGGDYLVVGRSQGTAITDTLSSIFVSRFDTDFAQQWTFIGTTVDGEAEHVPVNDRAGDLAIELDYYLVAYSVYDPDIIDWGSYLKFVALSPDGELLWENIHDDADSPLYEANFRLTDIDKIDDQNIIISGNSYEVFDGYYVTNMSLIKASTEGEINWYKEYQAADGNDTGNCVSVTADGGFVAVGESGTFSSSEVPYLVKTESTGTFIKNYISGQVVKDENADCLPDTEQNGLKNWLVTAELTNGDIVYHDITDSLGKYELEIDNGDYNLYASPLNQYWESCEMLVNTGYLSDFDTISQDFHLQALVDCPKMEVDISTPFIRRCFDTDYTVNYTNQGTIPAEDAYLEITFDEFLTVNSSTLPWSNQSEQTYTFDLGDMPVNETGTFSVNVSLGCDAEDVELGQTHCVEAHIYPDTICTPPEEIWDGSDIVVEALCDSDSIRFLIKNIGSGGMNNEQEYIIIEDHIILFQGPYQLPPDGEIEIPVSAEGIAYRLETTQSPGHPIDNKPSVNVEGCNASDMEDLLIGFENTYTEDDIAGFISIDCQQNIGSYDPNDKRAQPVGYGENHLIESDTDIEYHIRFQNTGTDTAFTVVVEDVISEALDLMTVVPGASSHPYLFDIDNGRKLKFTFNNILLPDSTTNEALSHGFIKFRISQMPANLPQQRIYNDADIFFDFNAPITTNTTMHTIGSYFIENYIVRDFVIDKEEKQVAVYPNPFSSETNFIIKRAETTPLHFVLYDVQGREVRRELQPNNSFKFLRKNLSSGIYFYRMEVNGEELDTGKIILR